MKKIVALIGKAGSGKDTILHEVMKQYPSKFHEIISCTTRPPREGEQDCVNYHFLTKEEFNRKLKQGDMLEASCFNSWYYGTELSSLREDKVNIGVFNPQGIQDILDSGKVNLKVYYVRVPAKERLLRQLNREIYPNVDEIVRRYSADEADFSPEQLECINYTEVYNLNKWDIDIIVDLIASGQNS